MKIEQEARIREELIAAAKTLRYRAHQSESLGGLPPNYRRLDEAADLLEGLAHISTKILNEVGHIFSPPTKPSEEIEMKHLERESVEVEVGSHLQFIIHRKGPAALRAPIEIKMTNQSHYLSFEELEALYVTAKKYLGPYIVKYRAERKAAWEKYEEEKAR